MRNDEPIDELDVFSALMALRPVRATYALIGLYIVLFGLCELWGGSESIATLVAMGAEVPALIKQGEWWRLLAATALHGGLIHILLNSYVLYSFGPFLEKLLGWQRFLVLYILSGLAGTLLGTAVGEVVGTLRSPHLAVTGATTTVYSRTATGFAGAADPAKPALQAMQNYIDVTPGQGASFIAGPPAADNAV